MTPAQSIQDRFGRMTLLTLAAAAVPCGLLLTSGPALLTCTRSTTPEVALLLRNLQGLHLAVLWGCAAIAVVVVGLMLYSVCSFPLRTNAGHVPSAGWKPVELVWTLIPVVILIGAATPAVLGFLVSADAPAHAAATASTGYRCQIGYRSPS
jgi:cytochrome c oxidase subunit II